MGRAAATVVGAALAFWVAAGAVRTVVLPRGEPVPVARAVFLATRRRFDLLLKKVDTYAERDRVMARYAPVSLIGLGLVALLISFLPTICGSFPRRERVVDIWDDFDAWFADDAPPLRLAGLTMAPYARP